MARIEPLRALHYEPAAVGSLGDVTAPPYDVIDAGQRARLIARSPYNVVAVDLPQDGADPYGTAEDLFQTWQLQGAVVRDRQPAVWAHEQAYTVPNGQTRTRGGLFRRLRVH